MSKKGTIPALDLRAAPSPRAPPPSLQLERRSSSARDGGDNRLRHVSGVQPGCKGPSNNTGSRASSPGVVNVVKNETTIPLKNETTIPVVHAPANTVGRPSNSSEVAFVMSLKQWQEIDATDYEGKWFQAVVVLRNEHHIRVHFLGWDKHWCENIPVQESYCRLRPRRQDTRVGPGGAQSVKGVMALHRRASTRCLRCISIAFVVQLTLLLRNPKDLSPYVYFAKIDARDSEGDWCAVYTVRPKVHLHPIRYNFQDGINRRDR